MYDGPEITGHNDSPIIETIAVIAFAAVVMFIGFKIADKSKIHHTPHTQAAKSTSKA